MKILILAGLIGSASAFVVPHRGRVVAPSGAALISGDAHRHIHSSPFILPKKRVPTALFAKADENSDLVKSLMPQLVGFGEDCKGGIGGDIIRVTSLEDNKEPGTLRHACESEGKAWIVFDTEGPIKLKDKPIDCKSFKTIDARGKDVTIENYGIKFQGEEHLIMTGIKSRRVKKDHVTFRDSKYGWIHQCKFGDDMPLGKTADGTVDITHGGGSCTVSWCKFHDHDKACIVSYGATDATFHHNYFVDCVQRTPQVRGGPKKSLSKVHPSSLIARVHHYNNYAKNCGPTTSKPGGYILAENNVFVDTSQKIDKNRHSVLLRELSEKDIEMGIVGPQSIKQIGNKYEGKSKRGPDYRADKIFKVPYKYSLDSIEEVERLVPKNFASASLLNQLRREFGILLKRLCELFSEKEVSAEEERDAATSANDDDEDVEIIM